MGSACCRGLFHLEGEVSRCRSSGLARIATGAPRGGFLPEDKLGSTTLEGGSSDGEDEREANGDLWCDRTIGLSRVYADDEARRERAESR